MAQGVKFVNLTIEGLTGYAVGEIKGSGEWTNAKPFVNARVDATSQDLDDATDGRSIQVSLKSGVDQLSNDNWTQVKQFVARCLVQQLAP
jgi:hypothetical protein